MTAPAADVEPAVRGGTASAVVRVARRGFAKGSAALADQLLSSMGNFAVTAVGAHALSHNGFGHFGILFAIGILAIGTNRSLVTDGFMLRELPAADGRARLLSAVAGATLSLAAALGALVTALALALGGGASDAVFGLFVVPGLLLQDTARYLFFRSRAFAGACLSDGALLVVFAGTATLLFEGHGHVNTSAVLAAWGAACWAGAATGLIRLRLVARPRLGVTYLVGHLRESTKFLSEYLLSSAIAPFAVLLVGVVASSGSAGSMRGAQSIVGPLGVIYAAIVVAFVPQIGSAARAADRGGLDRLIRKLSVGAPAALLAASLPLAVLPDPAGRALLGAEWTTSKSCVLPLVIFTAISSSIFSFGCALRALGRASSAVRIRLLCLPAILAAGVLGATTDGGRGASWGLVAGATVTLGFYRRLFLSSSRALTSDELSGPAV